MSAELQTALIGAGGAAVAQFLVVATTLERGQWPVRFKRPAYWLAVIVWLVVGGFVAWLNAPLPDVVAFQVGLSVKLLVAQLGRGIPNEVGTGEGAR